jgi:putative thioredoxin
MENARPFGAAHVNDELIVDASEADFEDKALRASSRRLVMVDFWADWCPPCRALTPVLERLTLALAGDVLLVKVEVDDNMHLAGRYRLRGFPTVVFFRDGEEVERFAGFRPESQVREMIGNLLA